MTTKKTVNIKKSAKNGFKGYFKKGKKAIKGKTISFKLNGKTFKAKSNAKGIVNVTIKKNVIKKLKKGKKYSVKLTYLKDAIEATVKVK